MRYLIRAELFKLKKNPLYWAVLVLCVCFGLADFKMAVRNENLSGYEMILFECHMNLYKTALLAVFAGSFLGDDFRCRIWGRGFLMGVPRRSLIGAKICVYLTAALIILLVLFFLPVILTYPTQAGGEKALVSMAEAEGEELFFEGISAFLFYFARILFLLSLFLLLAVKIKLPLGIAGSGMVFSFFLETANELYFENVWQLGTALCLLLTGGIALQISAVRIFIKMDLE